MRDHLVKHRTSTAVSVNQEHLRQAFLNWPNMHLMDVILVGVFIVSKVRVYPNITDFEFVLAIHTDVVKECSFNTFHLLTVSAHPPVAHFRVVYVVSVTLV